MGIIIGIVEEMIVGQAIFFREIGEKSEKIDKKL